MLTRIAAIALAFAFFATLGMSTDADAKRRCPRGFDDNVIKNVCTKK